MSPNIPSRASCSGSFPACSSYTRGTELWCTCPKFHVEFYSVPNLYLFCPTSPTIFEKYVYIFTYLTAQVPYMYCLCCQTMLPGNIFTQIWSGGKCYLVMHRRGAGLTVGEYVTLDKTFYNLRNKPLTQVSK
jgi:hypothetical protein